MENLYKIPPPPLVKKVVVPPPPPKRLVVVPPPPPIKKPTMAEANGWVPKKMEKWKAIEKAEELKIPYDDGFPEVKTVFNGGPHDIREEDLPF
jgi:hypothetical protein